MSDPTNATADESEVPSLELLEPFFPAYEFEGFIARGGMGAVYKARQISLDRSVAIKILPREIGKDAVFRTSFEAEAKAMARLNHPNLISVYDFGEADGMLFIIMEYVVGKSLHDSAYGKSIDPAQAGDLVSAISRGLNHAHENGILHRDIKPGNILLDSDANPKIGDFGLALPIGDVAGADDTIYGTPGYTAPEVYEKKPASPQTDVYSVGILLYELLTGSLPDDKRTPPSVLCGCPPAFDKIVARATQASPAMRYSSAADLADDLDKAVKNIGSTPAPTSQRLNLAAPVPSFERSITPRRVVVQKKSPTLPLGYIAAAIGVIAIAAIFAMQGGGGSGRQRAENRKNAAVEASALAVGTEVAEGVPEVAPGADAIFAAGAEAAIRAANAKPSPIEPLATLKEKLAAGGRDEFPEGTESRNGSHFLLVDRPMTWVDARRFAEEHGAHLAVLPYAEDRSWFAEKFQLADAAWLGGGMGGRDRWQWLDGTRWIPVGEPAAASSSQRILTLSKTGSLAAASPDQAYHFAIQWRPEAENPATVGAELRRTAESIAADGVASASFPVGTRTYTSEDSHFYPIAKAIPWDEARQLAKAAGGYLAVPSTQAEDDWVRQSFAKDSAPDCPALLWLGGYRLKPEDPWRWLTREAWSYSGWKAQPAGGDAKQNRAILFAGADAATTGWIADDAVDGVAFGLLVEWSRPKQAAAIENFDTDTWLAEVDRKFKLRVGPDVTRYGRDKAQIIDGYVRAMKREARKRKSDSLGGFGGGFPGRGGRDRGRGGWDGWADWRGERATKTVDEAMEKVEAAGDFVVRIPEAAPSEFRDIQKDAEAEKKKLDADYQRRITSHRDLYASGLVKQSVALVKSGFAEAAASLEQRAQSSNTSNNAFLVLLGLAERSDPGPEEEGRDRPEMRRPGGED